MQDFFHQQSVDVRTGYNEAWKMLAARAREVARCFSHGIFDTSEIIDAFCWSPVVAKHLRQVILGLGLFWKGIVLHSEVHFWIQKNIYVFTNISTSTIF